MFQPFFVMFWKYAEIVLPLLMVAVAALVALETAGYIGALGVDLSALASETAASFPAANLERVK